MFVSVEWTKDITALIASNFSQTLAEQTDVLEQHISKHSLDYLEVRNDFNLWLQQHSLENTQSFLAYDKQYSKHVDDFQTVITGVLAGILSNESSVQQFPETSEVISNSALASHTSDTDPHEQYLRIDKIGSVVPPLVSGKIPDKNLPSDIVSYMTVASASVSAEFPSDKLLFITGDSSAYGYISGSPDRILPITTTTSRELSDTDQTALSVNVAATAINTKQTKHPNLTALSSFTGSKGFLTIYNQKINSCQVFADHGVSLVANGSNLLVSLSFGSLSSDALAIGANGEAGHETRIARVDHTHAVTGAHGHPWTDVQGSRGYVDGTPMLGVENYFTPREVADTDTLLAAAGYLYANINESYNKYPALCTAYSDQSSVKTSLAEYMVNYAKITNVDNSAMARDRVLCSVERDGNVRTGVVAGISSQDIEGLATLSGKLQTSLDRLAPEVCILIATSRCTYFSAVNYQTVHHSLAYATWVHFDNKSEELVLYDIAKTIPDQMYFVSIEKSKSIHGLVLQAGDDVTQYSYTWYHGSNIKENSNTYSTSGDAWEGHTYIYIRHDSNVFIMGY